MSPGPTFTWDILCLFCLGQLVQHLQPILYDYASLGVFNHIRLSVYVVSMQRVFNLI